MAQQALVFAHVQPHLRAGAPPAVRLPEAVGVQGRELHGEPQQNRDAGTAEAQLDKGGQVGSTYLISNF